METFQIVPPESFQFSNQNEWPSWKRHFLRFKSASGLIRKTEEEQVNALIYLMGKIAEDIFQSFQMTSIDATNFDLVLQKFGNYFIVRQNVIYEHVKLNQEIQLPGERVDEFITTFYNSVEH